MQKYSSIVADATTTTTTTCAFAGAASDGKRNDPLLLPHISSPLSSWLPSPYNLVTALFPTPSSSPPKKSKAKSKRSTKRSTRMMKPAKSSSDFQRSGCTADTEMSFSSCSSANEERMRQQQQQEEEIVFDRGDTVEEDSSDDASSISSEMIQTGDAYWDAILLSALTEVPDEDEQTVLEEKGEDDADVDDGSDGSFASDDDSNSFYSDNSSLSFSKYSVAEDEDNEWTSLTNDVLVIDEQRVSPQNSVKNSTVLSECLWDRNYDTMAARLEMYPQEASQEINLSEDDAVVSKGLPLHLACAMRPLPPLSVFELLLEANPKAASQPETKWGMLPLHFAVNLGHHHEIDSGKNSWHQAQVVRLLLSVCPTALNSKEACQGRTALHLAASSTPQSIDGQVPEASANLLQVLILHPASTTEALWETDAAGETAYDMARQASMASMTVCFAGINWQANPLLQLLATMSAMGAFPAQKKQLAADDERSQTDATAATMMSVSSGSATDDSHQAEDDAQEESERSMDDDASFATALSSMEQDISERTLVTKTKSEVINIHVDACDACCVAPVCQEESTVKQEDQHVVVSHYAPCAAPVNKIMVELQLHASSLIRPRSKKFLPSKRTINPYYKIELVQAAQKKAPVLLHQSEVFFGQREACWKPANFTVDAMAAQARGAVFRFSVLHKRSPEKSEKKDDPLIGSYQTSLWDLERSLNTISLKGHGERTTGQMQLTSCHMEAVGGCLRIDF